MKLTCTCWVLKKTVARYFCAGNVSLYFSGRWISFAISPVMRLISSLSFLDLASSSFRDSIFSLSASESDRKSTNSLTWAGMSGRTIWTSQHSEGRSERPIALGYFLLLVFQYFHCSQKYQQQERRERIQIVSCVNPVQRREGLQGGDLRHK